MSRVWINEAAGLAVALGSYACASAGFMHHPYRGSAIDMAVSLKVGTVRTAEFPVKVGDYEIWIQADGVLPAQQMVCMMGLYPLAYKPRGCSSGDPLLRVDWEVREEDRVVARGSSPPEGHEIVNKWDKIKVIGYFKGQAGKMYSVEVKFTNDAAALDAANPHLIVLPRRYH